MESPVITTESSIDELREIIRDRPGTLYAILDACDEPQVLFKVNELGPERSVSLYRGSAETDFRAIAPYLVIVDEELLDWIVESLWGAPWGIFAVASLKLEEVRKHFRRFLMVDGPEGNELYFRFYDPRVLPMFLRACNYNEAQNFMGPLKAFAANPADSTLVTMSLQVI